MAAPVATVRQTPLGFASREGFHVHITIAGFPNISFWEKDVQGFGIEGGPPVDQTTQFNVALRTKWPRQIYDLDPIACNVAYDPGLMPSIILAINRNDTITVTFQDGSTGAFWGYLNSFKAGPMVEGQQPMAQVVFQPTNLDNSYAEQAPVFVNVPGS